ncbi:MAG: imidazolonepropionase [Anaerolineales bacterium]|nr:imidazolonepropionase [Anaerolineales bacterium]MCW5856581.1 imidazolonepropionase [Anaerolineales bacterium]
MLIHSASQVLTLAGGPQRGAALGTLGLIEDGAVLLHAGRIAAVGGSAELRAAHPNEEMLDARGRVLMPGFVDAHAHPIWAGDRATEFEQRLQGKSYLEILEAGGGILSTVRATRAADLEQLIQQTRSRLQRMFAHGSTTMEAKSGYGLDLETELRMLEALLHLDDEGPWDLALTFLGAHAIPAEFKGRADEYTRELSQTWLPELRSWWAKKAAARPLPFVDVFCETGAFSLAQSRQILEAAKALGFPLKIHSDEFDNLGGTGMAVELGAVSADHLVATSAAEIAALAASDTVAVALPATPFALSEAHYTPARQFLQAGGLLAVGGDLNPGTAWCESLQFSLALACRYLKLTPAEAIAATTINAAAAIQRQGQVGSIEVGKQADLLLLDVADYRQLGYRFGTNLVHTVIKKGALHVPAGYPH